MIAAPFALRRQFCRVACVLFACAAAGGLSHGMARAAAPDLQQTGTLSGGETYIVRRNVTVPTAAIELWYRAPGAGYDNAAPGISRLAIAAIAASAPEHGTSLAELVTRIGGTLSFNVYPDIAMVGVSVPSWQVPAAIRALTSAYFTQSITDSGLKAAVRDSAIAAAETRFDSDRLLQDALFEHLFSAGPAHYPPTPYTAQDFAKLSKSDVQAFAARAFRRSNAIVALTGSVAAQWASYVAPASAAQSGARADAPFDSTVSAAPVNVTQSAQVGGVGFAWLGPPIADTRAATAMDFIADYLFDADHGTVARALRRSDSPALAGGQFITLHDPGVLLVTLAGGSNQALRAAVGDGVATMQQPLDAQTFAAARNAFEYHILSQSQTPVSRADNFGWYAAEGNAGYAPGDASATYIKAAESLDPGYVAQIARKYLQHPAVVQLLSTPRAGTAT